MMRNWRVPELVRNSNPAVQENDMSLLPQVPGHIILKYEISTFDGYSGGKVENLHFLATMTRIISALPDRTRNYRVGIV